MSLVWIFLLVLVGWPAALLLSSIWVLLQVGRTRPTERVESESADCVPLQNLTSRSIPSALRTNMLLLSKYLGMLGAICNLAT